MSALHIAGTGSFAAEIAEYAVTCGSPPVALIELLDEARVGGTIHGLPVIALAPPPQPWARAVIGIGGDRLELAERLYALGWAGPRAIVHPTAHVTDSTSIADGAVIGPRAVLGAHGSVGAHTMVARGVLVGHHTRIGEGATLNPGANVAGNCVVGDGAFLGLGAVVVPGVSIGARAVVGAAALVLRDVPAGARVQGAPAVPYPREDAPVATPASRGSADGDGGTPPA